MIGGVAANVTRYELPGIPEVVFLDFCLSHFSPLLTGDKTPSRVLPANTSNFVVHYRRFSMSATYRRSPDLVHSHRRACSDGRILQHKHVFSHRRFPNKEESCIRQPGVVCLKGRTHIGSMYV